MTVRELILQLQAVSPETKVVVRGYEEGYNDIQQIKIVKLKKELQPEWYSGEYSESQTKDAIEAIELYGENRVGKE
jgi:hypothetical protein